MKAGLVTNTRRSAPAAPPAGRAIPELDTWSYLGMPVKYRQRGFHDVDRN